MRKKGINTKMLLLFAEHLESAAINERYKRTPLLYSSRGLNLTLGINGVYHQLLPFVVEELPSVFNEWFISSTGFISYMREPGMMNQYAALEFFRLPVRPMLHIFAIERQDLKAYGGKVLDHNSLPKDVAHNIYCFLETYKLAFRWEKTLYRRRVLVEKVSPCLLKLESKR